jgi:Mg2+ and Co2+ transporter CorA
MTKKLERKVAELEDWIARFEASDDEKLESSNLNFMVSQCKNLGDRLAQVEQSHRQLEGALQQNMQVVNDFISEQELDESWKEYLAGLQEDADASEEGQEQEDN